MNYALVAVVAVVLIAGIVYNYLRNKKIKEDGVETDAVVSRIKEIEKEDSEGRRETDYEYYAQYKNQAGETVEARIGNPSRSLREGTPLQIKYLPEKPKYVLIVKK